MWFWDGSAAPGWADYLGLTLTVVGFWIAFQQLRSTKKVAEATRDAVSGVLDTAQRALSQRALGALVPQLQLAVEDLDHAMKQPDVEVARRALVRFAHIAAEGSNLLSSLGPPATRLATRMSQASSRATRAKGMLMSEKSPDIAGNLGQAAEDATQLSTQVTALASKLRNTVEGKDV